MATFPDGSIVVNRYKIIRLLGRGGFGAVYLAEELPTGKQVALKENFKSTQEAQDQFRLEAELLAGLQHANLPRVTGFYPATPTVPPFLIMDYIEGVDLEQKIAKGAKPLQEQEALNIMAQICEAVAYLHTRKPSAIIHRDIKPHNIKVMADGRAVLVDFGIAKISTQGTKKVAKAITPNYSPWEQYTASTDERSDVYSLGATLYRVVTGKVPPDAIERLTYDMPVIPPRQIFPAISIELEEVILKALHMDPEQRYANANRLYAVLHELQERSKPLQAPRTGDPCPKCQHVNRRGARYCAQCGLPMSNASPASPVVQPAVTPNPAPPPLPPNNTPQAGATPSKFFQNVPHSPELLIEIGNVYARNQQYTLAIASYENCLQNNYKDAALCHNLGLCYLKAGRLTDAIRLLESSSADYSQDADITYQLAKAYQRNQQNDLAMQKAERACQLDPECAHHWSLLGQLQFSRNQYREARQSVDKALKLDSSHYGGYILSGRLYEQDGNLTAAIKAFKRAAQLHPVDAEPLIQSALCYYRVARYNETIDACEQAHLLNNQDPMAHYLHGNALYQCKDYNQALTHFRQVVAIQPNNVETLTLIGACLFHMGKRAEAAVALQQALAIAPNHQPAINLLGKL